MTFGLLPSMRGSSTGGFHEKVPSGYRAGALKQFDPQQMQLYKSLFQNVGPDSYLSRLAGGDESLFSEIEQPAMRQFGELQGGIASKFSGMGAGARRSSGFQNAQTQAASDFAQQLQANRMSLRNQAIKDLMGMSSELLGQRPYDRFLAPKQEKESSGWGGAIGAGLGGLAGFLSPVPGGAMMGARLGYGIGSAF